MKNLSKPNAEILAVLEAHGLKWETFAQSRSDSYEQQVAKASPEKLDEFYARLFSPGTSLDLKAAASPEWPAGTKQDGARPTRRILWEVMTRHNAERTLDVVDQVAAMMEKYRAKISKIPGAETSAVTDSLFAMLSQELLASKLEGEDLVTKTKALDRLLRKQKMDFDKDRFKEGLKSKIQSGLDAILAEAGNNPKVKAAVDAINAATEDKKS